jgi:hypothetical protein
MVWTVFRPKRVAWFRGFLVAAVISTAAYAAATWWWVWSPGRWGGLTFGTLAAVLFLVDSLYPLRRRLMSWPFGNAQRWLQFHIYGGGLACLFVLFHVGFRLPGGQFGWWLLLLSLWTTATGLVGVYLQKYVPVVLASNLSAEAIYERIPELSTRLVGEADRLLVGAPDLIQRFYSGDLRKWLGTLAPSWSYVLDVRADRDRRMAPFREMSTFIPEQDRGRLADLQAIVGEKMELDIHYSLQRLLRVWIPLHAVPAIVLMGMLIVHIGAVLLF